MDDLNLLSLKGLRTGSECFDAILEKINRIQIYELLGQYSARDGIMLKDCDLDIHEFDSMVSMLSRYHMSLAHLPGTSCYMIGIPLRSK